MIARSAAPPAAMPLDLMLESAQATTEEEGSCPHLYVPLDDCGCDGSTKE
eukprot:CAMPEP_0171138268 /NCGR_PEP_ID=MMETSP0766_2-20121228/134794_1 /TAXON_ID=439317 /ORGANISM="Gambierdiscus australes, Strain CAWD 149" /LENGTH=49 /DNA_ID= /DNA_START= /DNA_END= /DNA_ORIENTATION=